jgi:hypothetical protein
VNRLCELVEPQHPTLSMRKQCELLGVARSTLGYEPAPVDAQDLQIMRVLDEIYLRDPCLPKQLPLMKICAMRLHPWSIPVARVAMHGQMEARTH